LVNQPIKIETPVPRPTNTAERQEQIVAGLLEVMAERGYEKASVAAIARAAGLSPGLVHYHFPRKRSILLRLIERLAADLMARLEERLAELSDPGERLAAWVEAHLARGAEADPRRVACWVGAAAEATRDPEVAAAFRGALEGSHALLVELVRAALRARGQSTRRARALAAAIQASAQGYFLLSLTAPDAVPEGSASPTLLGLLEGLL